MPKQAHVYDDAEEYLGSQESHIKRQYEGRGYDKLTKTEQAEALLDLFFNGLHKYDVAAQKMRDGIDYAATPEVAWIDSKQQYHIHRSIKGQDRVRVARHERTYIRARREGYSRTASLTMARKEEHKGMNQKQIRQYEGRIGARAKYLKYSTVKRERKGYMPHGKVYRKYTVERTRKGRFKRWVR